MESLKVNEEHYKKLPYQPVKFASDMCLNFIQGNIVKYVSRYKNKDGVNDLNKILRYAQLGIDLNPMNFCIFNQVDDQTRIYVKKNGLDNVVRDIIVAACFQDWITVTRRTKLLYKDYE